MGRTVMGCTETVGVNEGRDTSNGDWRCYPVDVAERLEKAAEHAYCELAGAKTYLDGTLHESGQSLCAQVESAQSLRAQIKSTLKEVQMALHDCRRR